MLHLKWHLNMNVEQVLQVFFLFFMFSTHANFNRREADLNSNVIKNDQCSCPSLGASGPPGIPGVPGLHGSRGQDGNKGDKGEMGLKGELGPIGPHGPVGLIGSIGERGKKGSQGEKGEQGIQGLKGDKGERGYTGFTGIKGSKGEPWEDKRSKVAFSVMRNNNLGPVPQDTPINFDVIITNQGDAFEPYSSHFVCKVNGTYFFTSHVVSQESMDVFAWLMLNDRHKVPMYGDKRAGHSTGSQSVIFSLKAGDHVWMQLAKESGLLNDYFTFSGFLIYEE